MCRGSSQVEACRRYRFLFSLLHESSTNRVVKSPLPHERAVRTTHRKICQFQCLFWRSRQTGSLMLSSFQSSGHFKSELKVGDLGSECLGVVAMDVLDPRLCHPKCLVLLLLPSAWCLVSICIYTFFCLLAKLCCQESCMCLIDSIKWLSHGLSRRFNRVLHGTCVRNISASRSLQRTTQLGSCLTTRGAKVSNW